MKHLVLGAIVLLGASQTAQAQTASGNGALSLAALVSQHSPLVTVANKLLLDAYLDGLAEARHPRGLTIVVAADAVTCRISDVDITGHRCEITFGRAKITLQGRQAHALYATLIENGVRPDGAAGSIYAAITRLSCTIKTDEVAERDGGGASCGFETN